MLHPFPVLPTVMSLNRDVKFKTCKNILKEHVIRSICFFFVQRTVGSPCLKSQVLCAEAGRMVALAAAGREAHISDRTKKNIHDMAWCAAC